MFSDVLSVVAADMRSTVLQGRLIRGYEGTVRSAGVRRAIREKNPKNLGFTVNTGFPWGRRYIGLTNNSMELASSKERSDVLSQTNVNTDLNWASEGTDIMWVIDQH